MYFNFNIKKKTLHNWVEYVLSYYSLYKFKYICRCDYITKLNWFEWLVRAK